MAKEWIKVEFVTRNGKIALEPIKKEKEERTFKRNKPLNIRSVISLSAEDLKAEGDKLYMDNIDAETNLVEAYKDKKLKSKAAIKKAKAIIAKREKVRKKAEKMINSEIVDTNSAI